ncbi:hypothetical protein FRACYDRAFT_259654 [Fragilariopsis cylindrus CCMP1102]|uniref:SPX domain-containing protein n=2 Tax=Bacillariophycidae TaxID=33850 RepID=A0A1E7FRF2_9STRA|nr:hypothetical protein FRACYDRAFT_259654 [Fragilariopsis cylindrus CCMP1102]|eukprot:OEU20726.1 hypothetical protein FRACYDRAFT_259654 [Fragilariopsis cylindrus CCMP1102]
MKFCKNLQRVVDISDPEWAPYWTNYKMLKKLIKELPSLVPTDDGKSSFPVETGNDKIHPDSPDSMPHITSPTTASSLHQNNGHKTGENTKQQHKSSTHPSLSSNSQVVRNSSLPAASSSNTTSNSASKESSSTTSTSQQQQQHHPQDAESIGKSPGEVAFFKLLHSEFKKASHFFDRATEEFTIREERVREGMDIMRQPNSILVNEKWGLMAKSIYRLYKDLLLLETFAIMTYCSFSKILKKHDKNTGYETRNAFMSNIVNKANFTHYPKVLSMITRCERFYEEVSVNLLKEGKEGLYEDERLFINMIHRLNEQVLDSSDSAKQGKTTQRRTASSNVAGTISVRSDRLSPATSTLRNLLEENAKAANSTQMDSPSLRGGCVVSEAANNGEGGDDDDSDIDVEKDQRAIKRTRIS